MDTYLHTFRIIRSRKVASHFCILSSDSIWSNGSGWDNNGDAWYFYVPPTTSPFYKLTPSATLSILSYATAQKQIEFNLSHCISGEVDLTFMHASEKKAVLENTMQVF